MTDRRRALEGSDRIVRTAQLCTMALVLTSAGGAAVPEALGPVHAVLSLVLFAAGTGLLLWGYARGLARSRVELVTLGGLFFLSGEAAPPGVRRALRGATAVETVAVVIAAAVRPYTEVAFGILAPMLGLGLMAAWGGRHGAFPPRPHKPSSSTSR